MATKTETPKAVPAVSCNVTWVYRDRIVDTPAGADRSLLEFSFADGDTLQISSVQLSQDIQVQALAHGIKQKLVDAAAISRNPETGKSATVADKKAAVQEVAERLLAGEWNKRREGGETGGLLMRALLRMYDGRKTREEVVAFLADKTDAEKAALRVNPKVAAIIAEIKAEAAADSDIDSDAILGELDA